MIARPCPLAGRTSAWFRLRIAGFLVVSLAAFLPCLSHAQKPIPTGSDARTEENFRKTKYDCLMRQVITAYDKAGRKSPQYDEKVRSFLKDFHSNALWPDKSPGKDKLRQDAEAIAQAGCDDPLFLRAYACVLAGDDALTSKRIELFQKALDGFIKGGYPRVNTFQAALNSYGMVRANTPAANARAAYLQGVGMTAIAEAIAGGEFGPEEQQVAYRLLNESLLHNTTDRSRLFSHTCWADLFASLSRRQGVDVWLLRMIQGEAEVAAAWEARGGGYVDTVTQEGWAGFRAHLTKAYAALTEAWKLHPEYPEAPALLIMVAMGGAKGMGEDERTWFDRAVAAQMDYGPAYDHLLWALRPRWGGSYKDMYLFGLECLNTKRFDTWVPMCYLNTMKDIASEYPENTWHEAFQQPRIDECLDQLFSGMLKANADNPKTRDLLLAQSAFAAIWCGKFDKAKAILATGQSRDLAFPDRFFRRSITPMGSGQKAAAAQLYALTSPQGTLLLDAWALSAKGNMAKAKPLLEKALEESKGDPRVHSYALDQYGFSLLSEKTGEKINPSMGGSALYACAKANQLAIFQTLLDKGADINGDNGFGWTPLLGAISQGHTEMAELLLNKGVQVNTSTPDGETALNLALKKNMPGVSWRIMKMGADLNAADSGGWTPLHSALRYGCVDAATNLILKGADLQAKTNTNWTPLLFALQHGHFQIAQYLIEQGVDYNVVNRQGWTALHMALHYGRPDFAKRMIEKGADVNVPCEKGLTPLHRAVHFKYAEVAALLIEKGANINARQDTGYTPLLMAVSENSPDMARLLVEKGANVNASEKTGCTALMLALEKKQPENAVFLIEHGADVKAVDNGRDTPLHYAAAFGCAEAIPLLLKKGADLGAKDKDGDTPLDAAKKHNRQDVVDILSKP